jgi:PAS domain-containing protein
MAAMPSCPVAVESAPTYEQLLLRVAVYEHAMNSIRDAIQIRDAAGSVYFENVANKTAATMTFNDMLLLRSETLVVADDGIHGTVDADCVGSPIQPNKGTGNDQHVQPIHTAVDAQKEPERLSKLEQFTLRLWSHVSPLHNPIVKHIWDAVPMAFCMTTPDGAVEYWNNFWKKTTGTSTGIHSHYLDSCSSQLLVLLVLGFKSP